MKSTSCLSVTEVAETMGVCKAKIYSLIRENNFPCIKLGRRYVVPKEAFLKWLDNQCR